VVASILVFLFGGITMLLSLQLPLGTLRMPGSGLFPLGLGLILMGLAACQMLQPRLRAAASAKSGGGTADGSAHRVLVFMGIMALATALLDLLGFPLVAFLLMLALLQLLGVRRWRDSALIALLTAGASYILFVRWLQIPLPKGWIGL